MGAPVRMITKFLSGKKDTKAANKAARKWADNAVMGLELHKYL